VNPSQFFPSRKNVRGSSLSLLADLTQARIVQFRAANRQDCLEIRCVPATLQARPTGNLVSRGKRNCDASNCGTKSMSVIENGCFARPERGKYLREGKYGFGVVDGPPAIRCCWTGRRFSNRNDVFHFKTQAEGIRVLR
jgi:hypothetical protein